MVTNSLDIIRSVQMLLRQLVDDLQLIAAEQEQAEAEFAALRNVKPDVAGSADVGDLRATIAGLYEHLTQAVERQSSRTGAVAKLRALLQDVKSWEPMGFPEYDERCFLLAPLEWVSRVDDALRHPDPDALKWCTWDQVGREIHNGGMWWHDNGEHVYPVNIMWCPTGKYFFARQWGWSYASKIEEMGGLWTPVIEPERRGGMNGA